jgi:hypothetical protein
MTAETMETVASEDKVEELPTHDVQSSLTRHSKGQTAPDLRWRRLAGIRSDDAGGSSEYEESETAAEKRRRLAAPEMGGDQGEDSSDSDEEEGPRREGGQAVQESRHEDKRVHVRYGQEQRDRLRHGQRG